MLFDVEGKLLIQTQMRNMVGFFIKSNKLVNQAFRHMCDDFEGLVEYAYFPLFYHKKMFGAWICISGLLFAFILM